jgi:hypothetical protein
MMKGHRCPSLEPRVYSESRALRRLGELAVVERCHLSVDGDIYERLTP